VSYGTLSVVLDHNRPPIWHALAALPTLTTVQWQALVTDVAGGLDDRTLLRVLFERPDRSDEQRQWLIDQEYIASSLSEVMASPAATVEHVRGILTGKDRAAPAVAEALSQRVDLIDRPELVALAVEAIEQLDRYEAALTVAMRWPAGRPVPREVLDALVGRAVDVPRERSRRIWSKPPTRPVSDYWTRLLPVLCNVEPAVLAAVAARYQLVQAVLLEYGEDLDPVIVAACLPVWSDRDLGGPQDLPAVARLQTLRRWAQRYPELADQARSAWTSAGRDAARALRDGEQWELVDELVQFTTDPQILAEAVENVAGFVQGLIVDRDRGIERTLEIRRSRPPARPW
jgi:hypothetical protein